MVRKALVAVLSFALLGCVDAAGLRGLQASTAPCPTSGDTKLGKSCTVDVIASTSNKDGEECAANGEYANDPMSGNCYCKQNFKPKERRCRGPSAGGCLLETFCTGDSIACPPSPKAAATTSCNNPGLTPASCESKQCDSNGACVLAYDTKNNEQPCKQSDQPKGADAACGKKVCRPSDTRGTYCKLVALDNTNTATLCGNQPRTPSGNGQIAACTERKCGADYKCSATPTNVAANSLKCREKVLDDDCDAEDKCDGAGLCPNTKAAEGDTCENNSETLGACQKKQCNGTEGKCVLAYDSDLNGQQSLCQQPTLSADQTCGQNVCDEDAEGYCTLKPQNTDGADADTTTACGDVPEEPCKEQGKCTADKLCSGPTNVANGIECRPLRYCAQEDALYCTNGACEMASTEANDATCDIPAPEV